MHDVNGLFEGLGLQFVPKHRSLSGVLTDNELAALGDAFVNFVYSLALSLREGKPTGRKLSNFTLASALRKSGLRKLLPFRMDRHRQANAVEAVIVYAWLIGALSLREILQVMSTSEDIEGALEALLHEIVQKIGTPQPKT